MGGVANFLKAGLSVMTRPKKVSNTPLHLQIEPTTYCNLKCSFCVREKNVFKPQHMTFEKFKEVFDQVKPIRVTFAGDGEPTLCPDIFQMLEYVNEQGAKGIVTSNGTLGDTIAEKIVESGLWALRISIDAATAQTYVKMRHADFHDRIIEGIRAIQRIKKERGLSLKEAVNTLDGHVRHRLQLNRGLGGDNGDGYPLEAPLLHQVAQAAEALHIGEVVSGI